MHEAIHWNGKFYVVNFSQTKKVMPSTTYTRTYTHTKTKNGTMYMACYHLCNIYVYVFMHVYMCIYFPVDIYKINKSLVHSICLPWGELDDKETEVVSAFLSLYTLYIFELTIKK